MCNFYLVLDYYSTLVVNMLTLYVQVSLQLISCIIFI